MVKEYLYCIYCLNAYEKECFYDHICESNIVMRFNKLRDSLNNQGGMKTELPHKPKYNRLIRRTFGLI